MSRIAEAMVYVGLDPAKEDILLQCMMDPSHKSLGVFLSQDPASMSHLEALSRDMAYSLYRQSLLLLNAGTSTDKSKGGRDTSVRSLSKTGTSSQSTCSQRERLQKVDKRI
jgi:hypothetical protein